ncbi:MAG: serine/threonine-protein kinase, partial [Polyangiaceae bacterium]
MDDPASVAPAGALVVGDVLAERYRIDALLGQGGMGVVYRAEHLHLRKPLALKVLLPEWSSMPEVVARFEREAIAASNIQSPHVAAATDFGRLPNGSFFLVMEYVAGHTLRDALDAGALDATRALRIARGIVTGLHAAHSLGIVHRDLKPENVMLIEREGDPDFVKLLDFGIAKVSGFGAGGEGGASGPLTRVGAVIGTPDYMAPEQAMGEAIDARTDLYSVGIILFEMLAGKRPFAGEGVTLLRQHVLAEVPDLPAAGPASADPRLAAMVRRLLAKKVEDRFASAAELLDALEACLQERKAIATAATVTLQDPLAALRLRLRGRGPAVAAAAAIALTLLLTLWALGRTDRAVAKPAPSVTDPARDGVAQTAPPSPRSPAPRTDDSAPVTPLPPPPAPSAAPPAPASPPPAAQGDQPAAPQHKPRKTGPGGIYVPPP